ncbi:MAG: GNAT family N-acetyltransferase [Chthonomonas sp.]|nr:GNAT family N-acetyltransferase [Chthonomonas sp.]
MSDPWIRPVELVGPSIILRPLAVEDANELFAASTAETYQYYVAVAPLRWDIEAYREYIQKRLALHDAVSLVMVDRDSGRLIGESAFMEIRAASKGLEIGLTWIAEPWRGTHVNPEAKFLMLRHAFEVAGAIRVQLKTDARNQHSQAAIRKLGAMYEGTLRKHGIQINGYVRDTAMFSIVDTEWPDVKLRLLDRLPPEKPRDLEGTS